MHLCISDLIIEKRRQTGGNIATRNAKKDVDIRTIEISQYTSIPKAKNRYNVYNAHFKLASPSIFDL